MNPILASAWFKDGRHETPPRIPETMNCDCEEKLKATPINLEHPSCQWPAPCRCRVCWSWMWFGRGERSPCPWATWKSWFIQADQGSSNQVWRSTLRKWWWHVMRSEMSWVLKDYHGLGRFETIWSQVTIWAKPGRTWNVAFMFICVSCGKCENEMMLPVHSSLPLSRNHPINLVWYWISSFAGPFCKLLW